MSAARPHRSAAWLAALLLSTILAAAAPAQPLDQAAPIWRRVPTVTPWNGCFAFTDLARDRMLLLVPQGGSEGMAVFEVPLDGPLELREVQPEGIPPVQMIAAVHDEKRDRILFMNSFSPDPLWALELSPRPRWTTLATTGDVGSHGVAVGALDPVRDEYVVYESAITYPTMAHVRRLDLATNVWTTPVVAGPEPRGRQGGLLVYDSQRHRMLLHGGEDYYNYYPDRIVHDLWGLDLGDTLSWTAIQTDGPEARPYAYHVGAYDPQRDRLIVYGGLDQSDVRAYAFATGHWTTLAPSGPVPGVRVGPCFALDPVHGRILMAEGNTVQGDPDRGLWTLALDVDRVTQWRKSLEVEPAGFPGLGGSCAWDSRRSRALGWGGRRTVEYNYDRVYYDTQYYSDLWALSFGARPRWERIEAGGSPPMRQFGTMAYDETGDAAWLFGGALEYPWSQRGGVTSIFTTAWYGDVWRLDLSLVPYWTQVTPEGPGPSPREGHAMALDPVQRRLLVFGGKDSITAALGDLWSLSLDPPYRWARIAASGPAPPPRVFPAMVYDPTGRRLMLFGGLAADGTSLDDAWMLPLDGSDAWQPIATSGKPPRTAGPRPAIWDPVRSRMVVFGEGDALAPAPAQRVWTLDSGSAPAWNELTIDAVPERDRAGAAAIFDPVHDQALLLGGARGLALDDLVTGPVRLAFGAGSTATTTVALVGSSADPERVRLEWSVSQNLGFRANLDRREQGAAWTTLAVLQPEAGGRVRYEDRAIAAGHTYGYRLAWSDEAGRGITSEQSIPVPARLLSLEPSRPNPAGAQLGIAFSLPDRGTAELELIDIAGRVVLRRSVEGGTIGPRVESIDVSGLRAGVYAIRLTHGGSSLQRKAIILH